MTVAAATADMDTETAVFAALTVVILVGSFVLLVGVGAFEHMRLDVIGVGSAIMVAGVLGLAGYTAMLPEPDGHDAEAGH
jgi:hypothetical protein